MYTCAKLNMADFESQVRELLYRTLHYMKGKSKEVQNGNIIFICNHLSQKKS